MFLAPLPEPLRQRYLQLLGIDEFQALDKHAEPSQPKDLARLQELARQCTACPLHASRTQVVFGVGNPKADVVVIGEAPGFHEDKQGEPFVGRAGQLLNAMLQSIGLKRQDIYIANVLKCRPPDNRDPKPEEVHQCSLFLNQQIALIQPKLIVTVGRIAANYLLNNKTPLGRLRQQLHQYGPKQIPLLVTYHPAYLLRSPSEKAKAWQDLCQIKAQLT